MPFTNSVFALSICVFIIGVGACSFPKAPDPDSAATIELANKSLHLTVLDNSGWSSQVPPPKLLWFQSRPGNIRYSIEPGVRRLRLSCAYRHQTYFLGLPGPANPRIGEVVIDAELKPLGQYMIAPGSEPGGECVPGLIDQNGEPVGTVVERNDSYDLLRDLGGSFH